MAYSKMQPWEFNVTRIPPKECLWILLYAMHDRSLCPIVEMMTSQMT